MTPSSDDNWDFQDSAPAHESERDRGSNLSRNSNPRSLNTIISGSLLRGIPSVLLFRSQGQAFASNSPDKANYEKSHEVLFLQDFISHDWGSPKSDKFLTLCLVYNGWPAALISSSVALLLGLGQAYDLVPTPKPEQENPPVIYHSGYWCQLLCPFVFLFVLLWWQQLYEALRRRCRCCSARTVFLDKFCIDQTDEEKKQMGILGLAGFLRQTDRFVICWTPRYFSRLWCAYEVATWLFLKKPLSSVLFLPLSHGKAAMYWTIAGHVWLISYAAMVVLVGGRLYLVVGIVSSFLVAPLPVHKLRHFIHDLAKLPKQLESYSIREAQCFCCTHGHSHPNDRSVVLPCDRLLVQQTIRSWFSDDMIDRWGTSLDRFDMQVRKLFGDFVLKRAGPANFPYKYLVLYGWTVTYRAFDTVAAYGVMPLEMVLRSCVEYVAVVFFVLPCSFNLTFRATSLLDRTVGILSSPRLDVLLSVAFTLVIGFIFMFLWMAVTVSNGVVDGLRPLAPFLTVVAGEGLLTAWLFRDDLQHFLDLLRSSGGSADRSLCGRLCPSWSRRRTEVTHLGMQTEAFEVADSVRVITFGEGSGRVQVGRVRRLEI